jgi:uncharacterized protein (TIGR02001 family)
MVLALLVALAAGAARAQGHAQAQGVVEQAPEQARWHAPFGGFFSASLTAVSDYTFGGISQTNRQPAIQPSIGYRTPSVSEDVNLWAYLGLWGSNIYFSGVGESVEVDVSGGLKWRTLGRRLSFDLGYIRYLYPGVPAQYSYEYGEFSLTGSYDFGFAQLAGRIRFSPHSFGDSGNSWSERAFLAVPLPFLRVNENLAFKAYASVGNQSAERFLNYGLPSGDYWFWQSGLIIRAYGLDVTVAYTDTSIDIAGCGNTTNCQGRIIVGVTKAF